VIYLIEKSQCTRLLSQIADLLDRSNTVTHKVNVLKSDDLVCFLWILFEFSLQIQEIIILGNDTFSTRVTHALDHRSIVHGIGGQDTRRKFSTEGGQDGSLYSFKYDWIIAYVKMIIGTILALDLQCEQWEAFYKLVHGDEMTIGLVLMLLVKLFFVESLIVEADMFSGLNEDFLVKRAATCRSLLL